MVTVNSYHLYTVASRETAAVYLCRNVGVLNAIL